MLWRLRRSFVILLLSKRFNIPSGREVVNHRYPDPPVQFCNEVSWSARRASMSGRTYGSSCRGSRTTAGPPDHILDGPVGGRRSISCYDFRTREELFRPESRCLSGGSSVRFWLCSKALITRRRGLVASQRSARQKANKSSPLFGDDDGAPIRPRYRE